MEKMEKEEEKIEEQPKADGALMMHLYLAEDRVCIKINSYDAHDNNRPLKFGQVIICAKALLEEVFKAYEKDFRPANKNPTTEMKEAIDIALLIMLDDYMKKIKAMEKANGKQ